MSNPKIRRPFSSSFLPFLSNAPNLPHIERFPFPRYIYRLNARNAIQTPLNRFYGYSRLFPFLLSLNPLFGRRLPPLALPSSLLSSSLSSLLPSTKREGNTYLSDVFPLSLSPSSSYTLLQIVNLLIYLYYPIPFYSLFFYNLLIFLLIHILLIFHINI